MVDLKNAGPFLGRARKMRSKSNARHFSLFSQDSSSHVNENDNPHIPNDEPDRLLRVDEAAELLGLSIGGLYHLVSQRRVPVVRISSRCIRFDQRALAE